MASQIGGESNIYDYEIVTKRPPLVIIGGLVLVALTTLAFVAANFLSPSAHTFLVNHLSLGKGLLYIALPVLGLTAFAIHYHRINKKRQEEDLYGTSPLREMWNNLRRMRLKNVLLFLGAIALITATGFLLSHTIRGFNHLMSDQPKIWQELLYLGGGSLFVTSVIAVIYIMAQKKISHKINPIQPLPFSF